MRAMRTTLMMQRSLNLETHLLNSHTLTDTCRHLCQGAHQQSYLHQVESVNCYCLQIISPYLFTLHYNHCAWYLQKPEWLGVVFIIYVQPMLTNCHTFRLLCNSHHKQLKRMAVTLASVILSINYNVHGTHPKRCSHHPIVYYYITLMPFLKL